MKSSGSSGRKYFVNKLLRLHGGLPGGKAERVVISIMLAVIAPTTSEANN
ncbi:hypothetical protein LNO88_06440 [Klebsiella pneumoniae subsp. pneumoniae]|nr:hypothetical protein [Klebsiella pneumoniae subsp. pneumoniae]